MGGTFCLLNFILISFMTSIYVLDAAYEESWTSCLLNIILISFMIYKHALDST